jgi:hypothetical protein
VVLLSTYSILLAKVAVAVLTKVFVPVSVVTGQGHNLGLRLSFLKIECIGDLTVSQFM